MYAVENAVGVEVKALGEPSQNMGTNTQALAKHACGGL